MDKNTLWGLLCMAAIFFGFMYCNKPTQEQMEARQAAAEAAASADNRQAAVEADTLTPSQFAKLAETVKALGSASDAGTYSFSDAQFNLSVDSAAVSGTVALGSTTVNVADLHSPSATDATSHAAAVKAIQELINSVEKYSGFARNLGGQESTIELENDLIKVSIASRGAMIKAVELKDYTTQVGDSVAQIQLFRGANDGYGFTFTTADQRIDTREFNFVAQAESDTTVLMSLDLADGAQWGIRYTLHPNSYIVGMEIVQQGIASVLPASTASIDFAWHQTMARNEKGRTFEERNSAIHYKYVGDSPDDLNANRDDKEELDNRVKWVAFKNQFFSSVLIPRAYFSNGQVNSTILKNDPTYLKDMNLSASVPYTTADGTAAAFDFYFGPNDYSLLSGIDKQVGSDEHLQLNRIIPLGWGIFRYINTWVIIPVFNFLSKFISSYGIVILLLTLFIKLIIFPFTFKSFKSQARMRLLQPEIKQINEKYPGQENAMKRQQETMALYSRCGSSPFSGCLPMLLQMPVLIAVFSFFPSEISLRGASFLWAKDLSAPDVILTLPFSIPFYGNGVSLFCLMMTIVNIVYMHINMQNQPQAEGMAGMKWMSYLMPVMFLFIFNDYASGLSYYYFLSLLITIVQTWLFRRCINEEKVRAEMLANAKKPKKKSGFMARLEEAQRQQQAYQRQQQAAQNKRRR